MSVVNLIFRLSSEAIVFCVFTNSVVPLSKATLIVVSPVRFNETLFWSVALGTATNAESPVALIYHLMLVPAIKVSRLSPSISTSTLSIFSQIPFTIVLKKMLVFLIFSSSPIWSADSGSPLVTSPLATFSQSVPEITRTVCSFSVMLTVEITIAVS